MASEDPIRCPQCGYPIDAELLDRPSADRSQRRMKVVAMIQIALGTLIAAALPFMILGFVMQSRLPPGRRPTPATTAGSLALYVGAAAFLLVTGLGAWRCRRWVRPLMLSVCAPGAALGVVGVAMLAAILPVTTQISRAFAVGMRGALAPPPSVLSAVLLITLVFLAVIYAGIPAALAALYWSPHLQRVCERLDAAPRWTDGVPLPVLGTSLWLGLAAVAILSIPAFGAFPVFGTLRTGWATAPYVLLLAGASGVLCVTVFRRRPAGWYGTLALVLLLGTSYLVTFARVRILEFYKATGSLPPQQLRALEVIDMRPIQHAAIAGQAVVMVGLLAFLLYLRRFFTSRPERGPASGP